MKRTHLTDRLDVTAIGLGTAPLGGLFAPVSEADAEATIERAWSLGVRFFDTAPLYGFGLAERRLGDFLRRQERDSFAISTKVGRLLRLASAAAEDGYYKGTPAERPQFDFGYDGVMRSVEESLARLGLDRVDVLLVHDPDDHYNNAVSGAFRALMRLRDEGTVKAIGAGMNQSDMLARFAEAVPVDCFLLAGRYTLLDQGTLTTLFPICRARNIEILLGCHRGLENRDDAIGLMPWLLNEPHAGCDHARMIAIEIIRL
jgi:D-threo-aldose 1-dehydrogenase